MLGETRMRGKADCLHRVCMVWYVVVVTTTTCQQLGNDTTYDTEKRTRHHMMLPTRWPCRADVSGRHEDMSSKPTTDDI
jgi:hypothetical protein